MPDFLQAATSPVPYDVLVAGAGPAGCAAALLLHQAGYRVALADEAPTQATDDWRLGEALPGAARRLLRRLGLAGPESLLPPTDLHPCLGNASAWGSPHWLFQDSLLNPEGGGWHLHRARFDAALRRWAVAAGVPLLPARVAQVTAEPAGGYRVLLRAAAGAEAACSARWLVDATGRAAGLGRRLGLRRHRLSQQLAVACRLRVPEAPAEHLTRLSATALGWWYTAPLPDGSRVACLHTLPGIGAGLVRNPARLLAGLNEARLLPAPLLPAHLLAVRAADASVTRWRPTAEQPLLSVGDAALSFDPLSSQGIFFALYSGIKGAEAVLKALADPAAGPAAQRQYQAQVEQVLTTNQRSRQYYYATETRFAHEPYWQQTLAAFHVSEPELVG